MYSHKIICENTVNCVQSDPFSCIRSAQKNVLDYALSKALATKHQPLAAPRRIDARERLSLRSTTIVRL